MLVAMSVDLLVAAIKFAAAYLSNSSAMYAEALHSIMDASTEIALLYGIVAARRPSNAQHQLGFGREVYFWSFVAALLIFAGGAGSAVRDGLAQIAAPEPIQRVALNYCVLLISLVLEIFSTAYALYHLAGDSERTNLRRFLFTSGDSATLTILLGGLAGMAGLVLAACGLALGLIFDRPSLDGYASLGIALILAITAFALAAQGRTLLIGRSASTTKTNGIIKLAGTVPGVGTVNGATTVQLSPEQLLVALSVSFAPGLRTEEIEAAAVSIESTVRSQHPDVTSLFMKPQSRQRFAEVRKSRGW